ncbi:MAG: hypothetical protein OFPI_00740 [Osedax symbiont Rs2]|nr:MAG: hypothetical protein OFPI_00740 [Osedax symbiont Rs2]
MGIELEENHDEKIKAQIEALTTAQIRDSLTDYPSGSKTYRLQKGQRGGCGVFFNPNGEYSRYGLMKEGIGSLYAAYTPRTSMKEVFQNVPAIKVTDLDYYHMATLVTEKDLKIVDIARLAPKIPATAHQLTCGNYRTTQILAEKLSEHADGLKYISNVTLEPCIVLWDSDSSGKGVIRTEVLTVLSEFEYGGELAEEILVNDLNIPVI